MSFPLKLRDHTTFKVDLMKEIDEENLSSRERLTLVSRLPDSFVLIWSKKDKIFRYLWRCDDGTCVLGYGIGISNDVSDVYVAEQERHIQLPGMVNHHYFSQGEPRRSEILYAFIKELSKRSGKDVARFRIAGYFTFDNRTAIVEDTGEMKTKLFLARQN